MLGGDEKVRPFNKSTTILSRYLTTLLLILRYETGKLLVRNLNPDTGICFYDLLDSFGYYFFKYFSL
jgi:hypothetical protein